MSAHSLKPVWNKYQISPSQWLESTLQMVKTLIAEQFQANGLGIDMDLTSAAEASRRHPASLIYKTSEILMQAK